MSSMVWICRPCAAPTMSVPKSFGRPQTSTTRTATLIPHVRGDKVPKKKFWIDFGKEFLFRELVISGRKANVLDARIEVIRELDY